MGLNKEKVIGRAEKLASLAPRRGETERQAAEIIKSELGDFCLTVQDYHVIYPEYSDWGLEVDGEEIECLPSGLKSGKIESKTVVNSVLNGQGRVEQPNVCFNPYSDDISAPNFYNAPSLAIHRSQVSKIVEADEIKGRLDVQLVSDTSQNIILGNAENPQKTVLTHYDSVWGGFIDNGFSVSLLIEFIREGEIDLEETCVVFAGSEEISQESPYHCYGYRRFEAEYLKTLQNSEEILVVDSLGRGEQKIIEDDDIVEKAIVFNRDDLIQKVDLAASKYQDVLDIYHSPADKKSVLSSYEEALNLLKNQF